jgi:hypothetical protein
MIIAYVFTMINHCDRHITHLGEMDISFALLNISSKFILYLECIGNVYGHLTDFITMMTKDSLFVLFLKLVQINFIFPDSIHTVQSET